MIVRDGSGFSVRSEKGKRLGGPYKTHEEAQKRLAEVEAFKAMKPEGSKQWQSLSGDDE